MLPSIDSGVVSHIRVRDTFLLNIPCRSRHFDSGVVSHMAKIAILFCEFQFVNNKNGNDRQKLRFQVKLDNSMM